MTEHEYWYWLCNMKGIGSQKIKYLLEHFKTPEEIFNGTTEELKQVTGITERDIAHILNNRQSDDIRKNYDNLKKQCIYFVTAEDTNYPKRLKQIYDAPYGIYVKGELPDNGIPSIAIIGARNCTVWGREIALYISKELSRAGIQIISGLARGIDSYAHLGAIKENGKTFGVLGCGADICYPAENQLLYGQVIQTGGVLTEFPPGTAPFAQNFPRRNRLISGLSDGILVVEAKDRSGSLITVDFGLEQGREIYAIPGRITDNLSTGCNNLIKMGAKIVTNPADILEDFRMYFNKNVKDLKKKYICLEEKEKMVYAILSLEPKCMDEIKLQSKLNMTEVTEALLSLELKNHVKQTIKNYYIVATD